MCKALEAALGVQAGHDTGLGDRVIEAVGHVLFPAPQQLHRPARKRPGDHYRLGHVIRGAAPAESAAEDHAVHLDLLHRQPGGFGGGGMGRFAVLCRTPDLAEVLGPPGGCVHRLHGRVVEERVAVGGLNDLLRLLQGGLKIAVPVADQLGFRREPFGQALLDFILIERCARAEVPLDGERLLRLVGLPPGIGDHRHGIVANGDDALDARHLFDRPGVEALEFAAEHRAGGDGRIEHAGQLDIAAVHLAAIQFSPGVQALDGLADQFPVPGILEFDFQRRRQLCRRGGHGAECQRCSRVPVGDDALCSGTPGGRNPPTRRRRLHEHHARRRTAFTDVLLAFSNAPAAAGGEVLPGTSAQYALLCGSPLPTEQVPVALQFLGDELCEAGQGALPHLGTGDSHDDAVVRIDDDPGVDLVQEVGGGAGESGQRHAQAESRAGGAARHQKPATTDVYGVAIDAVHRTASALIAAAR